MSLKVTHFYHLCNDLRVYLIIHLKYVHTYIGVLFYSYYKNALQAICSLSCQNEEIPSFFK
jgi:hypothetical protein